MGCNRQHDSHQTHCSHLKCFIFTEQRWWRWKITLIPGKLFRSVNWTSNIQLQSLQITVRSRLHGFNRIQFVFWFKTACKTLCHSPGWSSGRERKVSASGSLRQSCSATSTHPLARHRSNAAASTFSRPSTGVVKHYGLCKHWTCARGRYDDGAQTSLKGFLLCFDWKHGGKLQMVHYNGSAWMTAVISLEKYCMYGSLSSRYFFCVVGKEEKIYQYIRWGQLVEKRCRITRRYSSHCSGDGSIPGCALC